MTEAGSPPGEESETKESFVSTLGQSNGTQLIDSLFATKRPKHVIQSLADATQNVAAGVGLGLGALVTTPLAMSKDGALGFVKGLGAGLAICAGMTSIGVVRGACQVGRGVFNTYEAVQETLKGESFWDSTEERWISVRLTDFFADLPETDDDIIAEARDRFRQMFKKHESQQSGVDANAETHSESNSLYSILDVSRTATTAEIRTAFRTLAVQMHPDKNPNDPDATIHFQKLQEAYEILSNEGRRHQYDMEGKVNNTCVTDDACTPFEEAFGAKFLHPFIGRVSWALYFVPNAFFDEKLRKELQRRRTLRITKFLARYTDGEIPTEEMLTLIKDALSTILGPKIMSVVANQYTAAARQHLYENGFMHEMDSFFSSKLATASQIVTTCAKGIKGIRSSFGQEETMKLMFSIAEPDVRRTVLRACRYLLYDMSASAEIRYRRALALSQLSSSMRQEVTKEKEERKNLHNN